VLSASAQPTPHRTLSRKDLAEIGRYFVPAADLIAGSQYRWTLERIKGDARRDCAF
jgi:hypothetical protein